MRVKSKTPWAHDSELAMVRDMIFPQHVKVDLYTPLEPRPDMRIQAVTKISIWSSKTKVPWPVSATMELLTAQLFDEDASRNLLSSSASNSLPLSNLCGNYAVRSTFATAFCRFVNGFVDKDVISASESSMFANAAKIGLPIKFVEFRHRVTHGRELPGSVELREMSLEAIAWLYQSWWRVNATGDPGRAEWEEEERRKEIEEIKRCREDREMDLET